MILRTMSRFCLIFSPVKKKVKDRVDQAAKELKEAYNKHNKALTHFLPYLRRSIRNAIKKAFRKYSDPYDTESHKSEIDINDSSFIFYDGYGDTTTILNYHQKKVENLL